DSNEMLLSSEVTDFFGFPFRAAIRDADGNALGGVRLSHMTANAHGRDVGAPLGSYDGLDLSAQEFFLLIGGRFTPFDAARLGALYPSHGAYVERVALAALRLVDRREILDRDAQALIEQASGHR